MNTDGKARQRAADRNGAAAHRPRSGVGVRVAAARYARPANSIVNLRSISILAVDTVDFLRF